MTRALAGLTVAFFSVIGLFILGFAWLFLSLPDVTSLRKCITTEMYHVRLCEKDPTFTAYSDISPFITGAVIMSEDASFYSHSGVDVEEMKESAIKDMNEGRFARGGSTITQQLAKNVFLTSNKNVLRKIEEIYLAFQIEKHFSKQKILTLYLNVVEFGENIYGIRSACKYYFNKLPSEVSPEQAAFLVFLLPNPKKYSQSFNRRQLTPFAEKTVKTILHKMTLGHKITEEEYKEAISRVSIFPWRESPAGGFAGTRQLKPSDQGSDQQQEMNSSPEDMAESPMGIVPGQADKDAQGLIPGKSSDLRDESNQNDDDFKFDFNPDESK